MLIYIYINKIITPQIKSLCPRVGAKLVLIIWIQAILDCDKVWLGVDVTM